MEEESATRRCVPVRPLSIVKVLGYEAQPDKLHGRLQLSGLSHLGLPKKRVGLAGRLHSPCDYEA